VGQEILMANNVQFETPENVQISYRIAGQGTRFVAWFADNILLALIAIGLFIVALIAGASTDILSHEPGRSSSHAVLYFLGLFWLAYSLGNLLYFGCCELFMRGQTIGKRSMRIRVVKADGFSLDPLAIFLRTIFRVIDHLPPLYIVPVMTKNSQRLGDLVAGTIVVVDEKAELGGLREDLSARKVVESQFQFDATVLKRATPHDVTAVERLLERWPKLSQAEQLKLLNQIVTGLAARLQVECPAPGDAYVFARDFLAAEYRRQHRNLG
jgi:uncharacterized RDD family membrane protein YckC